MQTWVTITTVPGKTTAKVTMRDGNVSVNHTSSTHTGGVEDATVAAWKNAVVKMEAAKRAWDTIHAGVDQDA